MEKSEVKKIVEKWSAHPPFWHVCPYIRDFTPLVMSTIGMPSDRLAAIKERLHDLYEDMQGTRREALPRAMITILNEVHSSVLKRTRRREDPSKVHVLSDHAFVRGLERYFGVDMMRAKDRMLAMALEEDWPRIEKGRRIVTFNPKEDAD